MDTLKKKGLRILTWIEQYTKTDMVYLTKGGFWTIFSQIMVSGSTLVLAIAFAHFVSKDAYGEYKFILSLASILSTFTLTGLSTAVLQSVTSGHEGTMNYAFWENIKWSALFFLITLGVSIYYFVHGNNTFGIAMLIIGCFLPFLASTNFYNSYLAAKKDFRRSAIYYNIIGNIFPAFCLLITIIFTQNPVFIVFIYFASNTLIGIILYIRIVHIYKPNKEVDKEALKYSKHLSLLAILNTLADNTDQILVFHYIGAAELAIYNFAIAIPSQLKGPLKGFAGLIFPKFVQRDDKEIREGMKNKYLILFLSALTIMILYILAAPYIFHIFFPAYASSIFYSQLFSISLFWIIAIPADAYLVAKKKIKEQYITNIGSALIQITLFSIGVIWWGLLGLVIAQIVTKILQSLLSIVLYERSSLTATAI